MARAVLAGLEQLEEPDQPGQRVADLVGGLGEQVLLVGRLLALALELGGGRHVLEHEHRGVQAVGAAEQ